MIAEGRGSAPCLQAAVESVGRALEDAPEQGRGVPDTDLLSESYVVEIVKKHGEPWIRVSPRGKQEEPESLVAVKGEIERRWGTIDLLDIPSWG
ncbi:hypothetical protein [Streptomyces scopuliridis]|uniref:hypothetical protein n=1 Tax=Streptomyces scopuliridis TaxID=452529 RepID=UPI003429550C